MPKGKKKVAGKKKVKRYTASQKKEILDFITKKGRGGQTKAVAKFGVTAATIASWRLKDGGSAVRTAKGGASKELRAIEELASLIRKSQRSKLISRSSKRLTKRQNLSSSRLAQNEDRLSSQLPRAVSRGS